VVGIRKDVDGSGTLRDTLFACPASGSIRGDLHVKVIDSIIWGLLRKIRLMDQGKCRHVPDG
jgi:hypothetical protein